MDFDLFKKTFFNHLYFVQDDCQSEADKKAITLKSQLKHNTMQQPKLI